MVRLAIDKVPVTCPAGSTVLDAALGAGIYIPNLCHHPKVAPTAACRLCLVEIGGEDQVQPACSTPVRPGMDVRTNTPRLQKLRRLSLELMLSEHPEDCSSCPVFGSCILQSLLQYCGASNGRFRAVDRPVPADRGNPLILRDMARCVKCGRCVRVCEEVRGVGVWKFRRDSGGEVVVGLSTGSLVEEGCRFCAVCVEICPTGALRDQPDRTAAGAVRELALVPCRNACPAHIDIPAYVRAAAQGDFAQAAAIIREKVPFPASLGRVCTHPCESECRRQCLNDAIAIRQLKRLAAQRDDGGWRRYFTCRPSTGKRAAVIGAGPAGLSAALFLRQCGHSVLVFETLPEAGGMLRYGIPAYRLPDGVIREETDVIRSLGVEVRTGSEVRDPKSLLEQGFHAVLLATGAHQGVRLPIPGNRLPGTLENISFLRRVRMGCPPAVGQRVLVLGGGSVAFDCARTALRLGAEQVLLACLEGEGEMKADPEELAQARREGIRVYPARTFLRICGEAHVSGVETQRVRSCRFDETGKPVLELEPDSQETLACDTVIFAVGQRPEGVGDYGLELVCGAYLRTDAHARTSHPGIFAAGDAVTGTRSVIEAIASGQKAASAMDRYLGGDGCPDRSLGPRTPRDGRLGREEGFSARRRVHPPRADETGMPGFVPAEECFTDRQGIEEARRCLQCDLRLDIEPQKFWGDFRRKKETDHEFDP